VIAAAKRGARAIGVEFNPEMVELSRQNAAKAGVGDKATFIEGDMYEADVSQATVLALFLLSTNLEKLTPKFLDMRPGTRIVDNTFSIPGWPPDAWETITEDCMTWCTSLLWIVPPRSRGWRSTDGDIAFEQEFQVSGTVTSATGSFRSRMGVCAATRLRSRLEKWQRPCQRRYHRRTRKTASGETG
jgi:hypothetical protein